MEEVCVFLHVFAICAQPRVGSRVDLLAFASTGPAKSTDDVACTALDAFGDLNDVNVRHCETKV